MLECGAALGYCMIFRGLLVRIQGLFFEEAMRRAGNEEEKCFPLPLWSLLSRLPSCTYVLYVLIRSNRKEIRVDEAPSRRPCHGG